MDEKTERVLNRIIDLAFLALTTPEDRRPYLPTTTGLSLWLPGGRFTPAKRDDTPATVEPDDARPQPTDLEYTEEELAEAEAAIAAELAARPARYELPGQPVMGRHLRAESGAVFEKINDNRYQHVGWLDQLGDEMEPVDDGEIIPWAELVTVGCVLLPLTDAEKASEALYGPIGARWGDPTQPCPYVGPGRAGHDYACQQGVNHAGPHVNYRGEPLGMTDAPPDDALPFRASATREDFDTPCTCGHPEAHRFGCPRFDRVAHMPMIGEHHD